MPRQRENKKLLIAVLLAAAIFFDGCSKKKQAASPPTPAPAAEKQTPATKPVRPKFEPVRSDRMTATLLVNDNRYVSLPCDVPVYIQCIIENPLKKREIPALAVPIKILSGDGKEVHVGLTAFYPFDEKIKSETVTVLSQLVESLPPGSYRVVIDYKLLTKDIKYKPARFDVTDEKAKPELKGYYRRRVLALQGKTDELLVELDRKISQQPENIELLRERVDALETAGRYDDALNQLLAMAVKMQAKSKDKERPVPDWVVFREIRLRALGKKNNSKGK